MNLGNVTVASARAGRAKSDYSLHGENAGYDGSNAYCGLHLGIGKTFALSESSSLDAYVRYFWSHQDGMSVKLRGSGDAYDFADVDSHRLRLGLRYSRKDRSTGECYAGLAWEHELGGEASASVGGDAAPSPSLKGSSYMLELGYRFLPQNSRVSYDFHINGWQGKRKGLSGGAVIRWAF
ncbi:autotransporter domain-containing protein [uncultured Selenomonas sp.]|uniref:autotransporter domain-containing protein n=1 Tax=uncultured Selenomonas sp. TaxID=159275 RepID=UPI0028E7510C|nr:autotransporter domain-containing protein [uncultured Selenomonas sp.]